MKRIRAGIILAALLFLLLQFDVFFSALLPPFNTVQPITIGILLIYLKTSLQNAYMIGLIMGLAEDYTALHYLGAQTTFYLLGITTTAFIRRTVITHENTLTVLLSGGVFFTIVFALQFLRMGEVNYRGIEETLFRIVVNSALAGIGYFIIKKIQQEIDKRFL